MESGPGGQGPRGRGPRRNWPRLLGDLLLAAGVVSVFLAGFAYYTDPSRAEQSLPRPVALASSADEATATPVTPTATVAPTDTVAPTSPASTATLVPTATATPTATPLPYTPGVPVRIVARSIYVDSKVEEMGTTVQNGQLIWETLPFVVGHYRETALAGQPGNAVFAGHVTSRNLGNVFINLYLIKIGDKVQIYTKDTIFTYTVDRVRLVLPSDTSVMNPTPDATATFITCAGDWLADQHDYSRRLIVTAKLTGFTPIKGN